MVICLADTLMIGCPTAIFNAFWFPYGGVNDAVKDAFRATYKLEIVTIVLEDEEVSVVRPFGGYEPDWISWALFLFTPAAACGGGCQQSRVP